MTFFYLDDCGLPGRVVRLLWLSRNDVPYLLVPHPAKQTGVLALSCASSITGVFETLLTRFNK